VASDLRAARQRLEQRPELLAAGSSSVLWAIMDQVVDGYAPVVAGLEHDIDQIEGTVFTGAIAPTSASTRCATRPPTSTAPSTRCSR
jgi:magnesium transporter